ncbi:uncharacterized protein F5Z01DRAFT_666489 [Emericellopsis atlantica]|uniref:UBX domain-containing protein n=1 Tax=Emericellopsis atlantica TaxID=2614577 RepID=A0A9P8CKG5_9HYPO|nr:uncharacterized protein F5Z01DRAFT_666489 [Emericellopsis atlantica]KAG9250333.1 hypothetical protein F5Z01DRAFT_666489 [Emericellopsis atlantica]
MEQESISMFCGITGASTEVAQGFLNLSNNDVSRAIELFFENPELASNVQTSVPSRPAATSGTTTTREGSREIIQIDSDDDDIMQVDDESDQDDGQAAAQRAAAMAQEDEDAAMARRLQNELYGEGGGQSGGADGMGEDGVRAPIGRTTETLIAPNPAWADEEDDGGAHAAFLEQIRRRRAAPGRSGGPFGQRIWDDTEPVRGGDGEGSTHTRRLADLFRPPYDIMERDLAWDDVRALGKEDKRWIMVNLQDMSDFNCQALNRDIWKDEAVKELIKDHFLFLQYDKDFHDAGEYINFYFPGRTHENPDNYPHVSIIDPRTGEQVKVWSGRPFPSAATFHAEVAEFLDRYSLAANSKNPVTHAEAKKPQPIDVDRMTEDEMLEMALKNSMAGAANSSGSSSTANIYDPDSLTRQSGSASTSAAKVPEPEPEPAAAESTFSKISSSNPHTEPDNDPATTTRIQFRHPTGRVIRRFNLNDPVRRIYEWLKAEPLEGKEGVEFELKKMPQGQDLIENLDATIVDQGLKQGTVMIEFIEE